MPPTWGEERELVVCGRQREQERQKSVKACNGELLPAAMRLLGGGYAGLTPQGARGQMEHSLHGPPGSPSHSQPHSQVLSMNTSSLPSDGSWSSWSDDPRHLWLLLQAAVVGRPHRAVGITRRRAARNVQPAHCNWALATLARCRANPPRRAHVLQAEVALASLHVAPALRAHARLAERNHSNVGGAVQRENKVLPTAWGCVLSAAGEAELAARRMGGEGPRGRGGGGRGGEQCDAPC